MADQRADTPCTPTARRALVNSGLPESTVEELRRIFIAIEAEAAADSLRSVEPADAEPPEDPEDWGPQPDEPMETRGAALASASSEAEALPPRGSLTDPVREHFEEWGVHMCDSTHLAGG